MDPILLQKQVRDNADELNSFLKDLIDWEKDMKRKDQELINCATESGTVPPVRSKIKRKKKADDVDKSPVVNEVQRIASYDYSAWEKFDVEKACAEVDKKKEPGETDSETDEDVDTGDVAKSREQALYEKELGNKHVKEKRWKEAIACYSKAIQYNPHDAIFYANRALCYLKTKQAKLAETDCTTALQLDSTYVKAYQRRALARIETGLQEDAKADFEKVLELEPNNSAAKSELIKLEKQESSAGKRRVKETKQIDEKSKNVDQNNRNDHLVLKEKSSSISRSEERAVSWNRTESGVLGGAGDAVTVKARSSESSLRDDDEDVVPVKKPPHLRSKKPLRIVPVQEVETIAELLKKNTEPKETVENSRRPKIVEIESGESTTKTVKSAEQISLPSTSEPGIKAPSVKGTQHRDTKPSEQQTLNGKVDLPPVPKTSVQFLVSWKIVRHNSELRYQFLKQIPGNELPQIFQESLESREFSEITTTLATEFLEKKDPVYPYLKGLSEVKRFSALVMFMSKTEKQVIKKLLQSCEENKECSKEDITNLMKCYEIK